MKNEKQTTHCWVVDFGGLHNNPYTSFQLDECGKYCKENNTIPNILMNELSMDENSKDVGKHYYKSIVDCFLPMVENDEVKHIYVCDLII